MRVLGLSRFDTERISVEQYTSLVTNITKELAAAQRVTPKTKLLWVDTTPVPTVPTYGPGCNNTGRCLNPPRFESDVVLYNTAAAGVVAAANAAGARIKTASLKSPLATENLLEDTDGLLRSPFSWMDCFVPQ